MGYQGLMSDFENAEVAFRLREEIARRRISRAGLAETARLSISTLEKAMSGRRPFTLATIVRLEEALGVSLRNEVEVEATGPALAPQEMGSYARQAVQWIEGEYLTLRASFGEENAVYAYRTEIRWSTTKGHLVFAESDRVDATFQQAGFVSMPNLSGHTYLMTSEVGQYRMIMLGRATRERRMFGLLSTLQVGQGSQLVPVSCPVALLPMDQIAEVEFGLVSDGDAKSTQYRRFLDIALEGDFCRLRR